MADAPPGRKRRFPVALKVLMSILVCMFFVLVFRYITRPQNDPESKVTETMLLATVMLLLILPLGMLTVRCFRDLRDRLRAPVPLGEEPPMSLLLRGCTAIGAAAVASAFFPVLGRAGWPTRFVRANLIGMGVGVLIVWAIGIGLIVMHFVSRKPRPPGEG